MFCFSVVGGRALLVCGYGSVLVSLLVNSVVVVWILFMFCCMDWS